MFDKFFVQIYVRLYILKTKFECSFLCVVQVNASVATRRLWERRRRVKRWAISTTLAASYVVPVVSLKN